MKTNSFYVLAIERKGGLTQRLKREELPLAADMLRRGMLVAFPTETVFGIGADATNELAVQKIFIAKGRPSDNPLIVHLADVRQLDDVAREVPEVAHKLFERFAPGPLTIVLKKRSAIAPTVTAGLDTVAVRIPSHPIALELLRLANVPIAAPSANLSGRPSGTTWQAVLEDLNGRIDAIVCEPGCNVGLESTVVDVSDGELIILRMGSISIEDFRLAGFHARHADSASTKHVAESESNSNIDRSLLRRSPGTMHPHYRPAAKVCIVDSEWKGTPIGRHIAYGGLVPIEGMQPEITRLFGSVNEYAAAFYEFLRECDRAGIDVIYCQSVEETELGTALMDRMRRAADQSVPSTS